MPTVTVTRTYLELRDPTQFRPSPRAATETPEYLRHAPCPVPVLRRLYRDVGDAWHWHDLNAWSDDRLAAHLDMPGVVVWEMRVRGECAGYFQLQRHEDGSVEIVHFGLTAPFIGRGFGAAMLARAVDEAWMLGASRVWLHTCTLDSPHALPNYTARGFVPYRTEQYSANID